jgi:hypothetical protein
MALLDSLRVRASCISWALKALEFIAKIKAKAKWTFKSWAATYVPEFVSETSC